MNESHALVRILSIRICGIRKLRMLIDAPVQLISNAIIDFNIQVQRVITN